MSLNVLEKSKAYQGIKKKICQQLITEWQPNDRLPPIKDLAVHLGVGQSSTYQAVKELVQEGILVSKPRLGTFVNNDLTAMKPKLDLMLQDQPGAIKLPLSGRKIQLMTCYADNRPTFFTQAVDSFTEAITRAGGEIICTFINDAHTADMEPFLNPEAQGVAVVNLAKLTHITCRPDQVVTVISPSRENTIGMTERFDLIAVDDIQGSTLAGDYFRQQGYPEACFLGVIPPEHPGHYDKISSRRLEGFVIGLKSALRPEWQLSCDYYGSFDATQSVSQWLKLSPRPAAVFAASDDLAYGFIHGAMTHGLKPGRDFQIMGFDGQLTSTYCRDQILTSVAVPISEMGTVGARAMITRLENPTMTPQRLYLGCKLFEGNSFVKKVP